MTLLLVLALVVTAVLLALVAQGDTSTSYRTTYVQGCMESGANRSYCGCTYDDMHERAGDAGVMRAAEEYAETGRFSADEHRAAIACLGELN